MNQLQLLLRINTLVLGKPGKLPLKWLLVSAGCNFLISWN